MEPLAKINVLIVTYKHANVIARTLESILCQRQHGLGEIIICDDCSPDNNWEIISHYVSKFPEIIKAYRNENNLGIYGNSDKLVTLRGDADLYCWLEGDDALCDGFFESIQKNVSELKLDFSQAFGLCGNWKTITPNGNEYVNSNSSVAVATLTPVSMYLRGLATWRGSVFSAPVLDKFTTTILDQGLNLAETLFDAQFFKYSDKLYYSDFVGTIYYSEMGISTTLGQNSSYRNQETLMKAKYMIEHYGLDRKDTMWWKYILYRTENKISPSIAHSFKALFYYIKGVYRGPGCLNNKLRRYVTPIIKDLLKIK